jgi:hypothetical protein
MIVNCDWLPPLVLQDSNTSNEEYLDLLYFIFSNDFIDSHPIFDNKIVKIRFHPRVDNREQAFYHVTTCGDSTRELDIDRCERIRWIRAFIEHASCHKATCSDCNGMKMWSEPYHGNARIKIFLSEERYLVVLEKRTRYVLLITAYYVSYDHSLAKLEKSYAKARGASFETPPETPSTLS